MEIKEYIHKYYNLIIIFGMCLGMLNGILAGPFEISINQNNMIVFSLFVIAFVFSGMCYFVVILSFIERYRWLSVPLIIIFSAIIFYSPLFVGGSILLAYYIYEIWDKRGRIGIRKPKENGE